jgi:hypothetical protein
MSRFICLECEDREVFLNLDQVSEAAVSADEVTVHFAGGKMTSFTGPAAHELVQALRHEERMVSQVR